MNICKPCVESRHTACYGVMAATEGGVTVCACSTCNHTDVYKARQVSKYRRRAARHAAAKKLSALGGANVDHHANVLHMDGNRGAYVEASIYVTEDELQASLSEVVKKPQD
jgi:hypothetical protein